MSNGTAPSSCYIHSLTLHSTSGMHHQQRIMKVDFYHQRHLFLTASFALWTRLTSRRVAHPVSDVPGSLPTSVYYQKDEQGVNQRYSVRTRALIPKPDGEKGVIRANFTGIEQLIEAATHCLQKLTRTLRLKQLHE